MPAKHAYKCLNYDRCPSYAKKNLQPFFTAMNSPQPTCPHCGSIKLEDGGVARNIMSISGDTRRIDAGLKDIAAHHGLTNMSNKDGKAIKGTAAAPAKGDFGAINVNGVNVPVDHNPTVSRLPITSHMKVKPLGQDTSHAPANVMQRAGG